MTKYYLSAAVALLAFGMSARHLSPGEALGRVSSQAMRAPAVAAAAPQLMYSAKADGVEQVYVFGNAAREGFMVLSADDAVAPVLAYSDSGTLDYDNLPDNLRWWLDEYARQIAYAAVQGGEAAGEPAVKQRPAVAPKITTRWDQVEPFNSMTPTYYGMPCPTGCVATALAQIMNWHKWPEQPTGTKSFDSYYVGQLSIDFSKIKFEWDKMLDRYYISSPQENINAVATLMMAVGYASEMTYHSQSSGATGYNAAEGMLVNFGYNKSMTLENREWYGIEEWDDLVYAELTENGPVYYEGTGDGGGHAFVCDGYDSESGFFHFNWGWSGSGDGYYRLSALNPDVQGTGGNSLGYNYTQDIIRGLKKSNPDAVEPYTYVVGPIKGVVTPWDSIELGKPMTIKGYETNDGFKNYSVMPIPEVELGVRVRNVNTGATFDIESQNGTYDFEQNTKVQIVRFVLPTDMADGSYTMVPVWRTQKGPWRDMRMSPQTRNYVPFDVADGVATFGLGEAEGKIEVTLATGPDFYTTNGEFTVTGSMKSTGVKDFSGLLCAVFVRYDNNRQLQIIDQGAAERVDLEAGRTIDWTYTSKPQNGRLADGDDYYIVIGNANTGELVSPLYPAKVGNRYGELDMSSYNFNIAGSNFLDPSSVSASANIRVVAGEYEGPLALAYSLAKEPFVAERYTVGESVHLIAGDDKAVTINGIVDDVEAGAFYYVHLMYKNADDQWTQLSAYPVSVLIANSYSGVENISADDATGAVYYDVFGRKVDTPVEGNVYIRVTPSGKAVKVVM